MKFTVNVHENLQKLLYTFHRNLALSTGSSSALHQAPPRVVGILIRLEDTWSQAEGCRVSTGVGYWWYILVHDILII